MSLNPGTKVVRQRESGPVTVVDPRAEAKKRIEDAYTLGEQWGLAVWTQMERVP